jgi:hypothetical protein
MGPEVPTANPHSARLSWAAAGMRLIRDSTRCLAASTNRERGKSPRTLQGPSRLPWLTGSPHIARCAAQTASPANTCAGPQFDRLISRAGWQTGSIAAYRSRCVSADRHPYTGRILKGEKALAVMLQSKLVSTSRPRHGAPTNSRLLPRARAVRGARGAASRVSGLLRRMSRQLSLRDIP